MEKFEKLGISNRLLDTLNKERITSPTEIQEKTIPLALKGTNIVGGSATGSGKTLAFSSPIVENLKPEKKVQALILTPTRELAEQVSGAIEKFSKGTGLKILAVYGGVNIDNQIRKLAVADIVIGTPGRILDHLNRRTLSLRNIRILVLDEVDRMFDMGFQHDVEKIINECPKQRQTMMFSATVSDDVTHLVKKYTDNAKEISVKSYVDPSKMKQVYYDVPSGLKFSLLVQLLKKDSESNMVFCSTRKNVDFIANNLKRQRINAMAIHGGMPQNKRQSVLNDFHKKGGVLVCTDVAARGLDIKNVSHIYNYDIPGNPEDYIHRIGRTARAGKEGDVINILSSRDYENFSKVMDDEHLKIEPKELPFIKKVEASSFPERKHSGNRNFDKKRNNNFRENSRNYRKDNFRKKQRVFARYH